VREHVDGLQPFDTISGVEDRRQLAREDFRIARDIHHTPRLQAPENAFDHFWRAALARRIQDDDVEAFSLQALHHVFHALRVKADVAGP
jgi:hypothetical protein